VTDGSKIQLQHDFEARTDVGTNQLRLAADAWHAFTSPNPDLLLRLIQKDTSALPFLKDSFFRLLQEFPDLQNGLARNEKQILEIVNSGIHQPIQIFKASQKFEDPVYLGDWSFWRYMNQLIHCQKPLLQTEDHNPFLFPPNSSRDQFFHQKIHITDVGIRVLQKHEDWIHINGIDKWFGGVHVKPDHLWRWDERERTLIKQ
jgi:hypothetical protein